MTVENDDGGGGGVFRLILIEFNKKPSKKEEIRNTRLIGNCPFLLLLSLLPSLTSKGKESTHTHKHFQ